MNPCDESPTTLGANLIGVEAAERCTAGLHRCTHIYASLRGLSCSSLALVRFASFLMSSDSSPIAATTTTSYITLDSAVNPVKEEPGRTRQVWTSEVGMKMRLETRFVTLAWLVEHFNQQAWPNNVVEIRLACLLYYIVSYAFCERLCFLFLRIYN